MSKQIPLCIYHANCTDGFGAAWAVNDYFRPDGGVELLAASYGDEPPDVTGRTVFIVDFSYKRDVLLRMATSADHITVIDHHKTAKEDLENIELENLTVDFDMAQSGAVLAWKYFRVSAVPLLLQHIQDRDLWQFKISGTREILSAFNSYDQTLAMWDELILHASTAELHHEGAAIERKYQKDLASLDSLVQRGMIAEHEVPVANVNGMFASDFGNRMLMANTEPFSATYYDTPKGRKFSLRSTDTGVDVSAIAKSFGGGGHRNAAGFFIPRNYADHAQFDLLSSGFLKG